MPEHTYLECPCCGDDGAESDDDGLFHDGQPLICGCAGHVVVDEESDDPDDGTAWINAADCERDHGTTLNQDADLDHTPSVFNSGEPDA